MTPDEYCQQRAASSGSSFYYSFLFLPPKRRRAITALYAYCREVDDVVDECEDAQIAATKLAWWRLELERLYAGQPEHPVTRALLPILAETLSDYDNVEIVPGDILKTDIPALCREKLAGLRAVACANLPYNITTPVITAVTVSHRIRSSSNQPSPEPSSMTYCIESRKTVMVNRPNQSMPLARLGSPLSKSP